jgi:hypothetical protein
MQVIQEIGADRVAYHISANAEAERVAGFQHLLLTLIPVLRLGPFSYKQPYDIRGSYILIDEIVGNKLVVFGIN